MMDTTGSHTAPAVLLIAATPPDDSQMPKPTIPLSTKFVIEISGFFLNYSLLLLQNAGAQ